MKLQSKRNHDTFYVNWWLTDHCNYNCSYCPQELKRGEIPFIDLRHAKSFLNKIKLHTDQTGKSVQLDVTGGEITEWAHLNSLLTYSKSLGFFNSVRTNGSKDRAFYDKFFRSIDRIELVFHPEHAQKSHFLMIVTLALSFEDLDTSITIKCLPEFWDDCKEIQKFIESKWKHISVKMQMLFEDPIKNTVVMKNYSEEQLISFENKSGDLVFQDNNGIETITDYQTLVLHKKNVFTSMNCMIGIEQIVVDATGTIYRGHCRQGKVIGTLDGEIFFPENPKICGRPFCPNAFDIQATKFS